MLKFIKKKEDCTGCGACVSICHINCIVLRQDDEGFYYPYCNKEKCIDCGNCKKVCPIENGNVFVKRNDKIAIAAVSKSQKTWKLSTSGGAFTEICNSYGDEKTIIFGARWDKLSVIHTYVRGVKKISHFRKSKYIQSYVNNCLVTVKQFLEEGERVIFSGTPCQIAGLKNYLKKEYKNLLLIDFICHGVGSQKVFEDLTKHIGSCYNDEIIAYTFRNKVGLFGNITDFNGKYFFRSGKSKLVHRDTYYRLYLSRLCIRPSCSNNCKFHHADRISDITIADFKGKNILFPDVTDYRNFSTIIFNSSKGKKLYCNLKTRMNCYSIKVSDVSKYNPNYTIFIPQNPRRDIFFEYYKDKKARAQLFSEYHQTTKLRNPLRRGWKSLIPYVLKIRIKNFKKRCISSFEGL